jgi:kumamolisin
MEASVSVPSPAPSSSLSGKKHHYALVHQRLRGVRIDHSAGLSARDFPGGTLSIEQILIAYGFTKGMYASAVDMPIAIGSLGGGLVQKDVDNAVDALGMLTPSITVVAVGGATNNPSDQDPNVENSLDLLIVSFVYQWLTGRPATIFFIIGPNKGGGMTLVTREALARGCKTMSWSWGSGESGWDPGERTELAGVFAEAVQQGMTVCAASGDDSEDDGTSSPDVDYPAADVNVWGVGGTFLAVGADGLRGDERAWGDGLPGDSGGGGGFDSSASIPSFQFGVVPGNAKGPAGVRGVPDTSANADPNSGWQVSANGSWTVIGGTSAASPFTAVLIDVAKGLAAAAGGTNVGLLTPAIYAARAQACNDITIGSDGYQATKGWDPATGLGTPNGPAFINALVSAMVPASAPPAAPPAPAS